MDAVPYNWSATRVQQAFSHSRSSTDTLTRLAKLMARADQKHDSRSHRQHPNHLFYQCPECGLGFANKTELLHHQELKHTLPKPHHCLSCGKGFSLMSSLQLHKCIVNTSLCEFCLREPGLRPTCPVCTSDTSDPHSPPDKLSHQQPRLHDNSPYACAPCGKAFSQKQALLYHQQAGCSEPSSPLNVDNPSSPPPESPQAVSEAGSTPSDSSDTTGPSSQVSEMCPYCSRWFRVGAGLSNHKRLAHPKEMPAAKPAQKAKGGNPGGGRGKRGRKAKVNGSSKGTRKDKQKVLNCRSCDLGFTSTAMLYLHRKEKHRREKTKRDPRPVTTKRRKTTMYPCLVCGKVFLHHLSLRVHSKQHATSAVCDIQRRQARQSIVNTTKESKLEGKQPKKLKHNMEDNKTVNTEVKAYPEKRWTRVKDRYTDPGRTRRMTNVEEDMDREFLCPSCPQVFTRQSDLREHVELHQSSVSRRNCSVCTHAMDTCKKPGSKRQRLYHCVPCQRAFSALDTFLEHCQEHLRIKVEEDSLFYNCNN